MKKKLIVTGFLLVIVLGGLFCWLSQEAPNVTLEGSTDEIPVVENKSECKLAEKKISMLKERIEQFIREKDYTVSIYVKPLMNDGQPLIINDKQIRAASMIKIFIMAETFRQAKAGVLSMNEEYVITAKEKVGGSGVLQGMPEGTCKTLRELVSLMITESDNTATNIIIDRVSVASVNQLISDFGLKNTILRRKMMDTDSVKNGRENYTSVADLVEIFTRIYHGSCVGKTEDTEMLKILLKQTDNDKIPARLPANVRVAHKTGELVGAMHDAGIIYGDEQQNYIVCIMTENVISPQNTISDMAILSEMIYRALIK